MIKFNSHFSFSPLERIVIILISLSPFFSCKSQVTDLNNSYDYKILNKETFDGFPDETWSRYNDIYQIGWLEKELIKAKNYYDDIGSASALLIHKGAIVFAWGDVKRKYMAHSIRKNFLFSLYGIHEREGSINLNKTIGELGINDKDGLSDLEKQAKIIDLLKCESGIYHKAAYESPNMEKQKPARHTYKPGEFWYYNNWDYNALGTIFEQETQTKIFEEFNKRIANPIEMEDFIVSDGRYSYDSIKSYHPAYPFVMSTNDMARFGLLYLNNGKWKNKQIISKDWVKKSTAIYSYSRGFGNGFKWVKIIKGDLKKYGTYQTSGYKGHRIIIIPELDMVFIHRVNTFNKKNNVSQQEIEKLLMKIIQSNHSLNKDL